MASPNQIPAIYARSIDKYQQITDQALDVEFLKKLQNVDDLTNEIDARNKNFAEFRQKRSYIFDAMKAALIPIQLFGDLTAGAASMAFPPTSLVFGAVTYLMTAAKGVSASYDAIHELMESLKDFTIRLKAYGREAISDDLSDKLSDILVTLVDVFALSTKTIRRGRLLKFTRNFLLGNDDAIQGAMRKLDKLTQVEGQLVGAETLTEAKRTGRVVDDVSITLNTTSATVTETGITVNQMSMQVDQIQDQLGTLMVSVNEGKQASSEDREKSLQSLVKKILKPSKTDSAQDWYDKINKSRVPGTGDWIRTEDIFKQWLSRDTPIIFVSGNPGAGKSYLSTNIINFLRDQHPQHGQSMLSVSVGYFFFKDDNPDTRSFHQALRDLAYQISKNDPVYQKHLATIEEYERLSTLQSAWRLLFLDYFVSKPNVESSVYILLDALDEALDEERKIFLSLAKDLYSSDRGQSRLQLAVVGRPHISDQLFEGLEVEVPTIHVTTQKNHNDIDSYIHASIRKSVILKRASAKLRQEIVDTLSSRAEGMFLWVNLMLQELVKKRSESSIRKALEDSPRGLKEILRHVLSSFSASSTEEELDYLNEILVWVATAQQPLTIGTVDAILRLKSPDGDGMIYLEGSLRRQFASFFNLDREDGLNTSELQNTSTRPDLFDASDDEDQQDEDAFEDVDNFAEFSSDSTTTTITFSHASIGDFFRDETEGPVAADYDHVAAGVSYRQAKAHVLKSLLRLLTDKDFAKRAVDDADLLNHAAQNWVYHLHDVSPSECSDEDKIEIAQMLLSMFQSEEIMTTWIGRRSWVSTNASVKAVRQWWLGDVLEALSQEDRDFIADTEEIPITTFRKVVMYCIKKWLCEYNSWLVQPLAAVVWSYQRLEKGNEVDFYEIFNPTADELVDAANFGGPEKHALWHRRLAMALRDVGHYEEAIEHFNTALTLEPDEWLIRAGLATTFVQQEEWQKAISLDQEVTKIISKRINDKPEEVVALKTSLHTVLERMAGCYQKLGEEDKRFECIKKAYESTIPFCNTCINSMFKFYGENEDHDAVIELLVQLDESTVPGKDHSKLTQALLDTPDLSNNFFIIAAAAAMATGHLDIMVQSWKTAAKAARTQLQTVSSAILELSIGRLYSEYLCDTPRAVKRWEQILSIYATSKDESLIGIAKMEAAYHLAKQLLCDAAEAGIGSPEAKAIGARLEKLAKRNMVESNITVIWTLDSVRAISLGVYYRLNGQEAEARAQFRPSVKRGIDILSDDDPENDIYGLVGLIGALISAGDVKNVHSIAYAVGKLSAEGDPDKAFAWSCDGLCRKESQVMDTYSLCPICYDTSFCPDCVKLLEAGELGVKRCSTKHVKEFIYIPEQPKNFAAGEMLYDGEIMSFEDWKSQLRRDWQI
ncbi:NACHT and TPR domain protein [Aspergillus stella-maris]|uniref:NACHT and TPR domain protein n=1 Tax=Aspergillus stella-maris TaxID=1810926 RepID=UPI003CCCAEBC